jgi:hypothetical protein
MILLAIDPGNIVSGWVLYDTETHGILDHGTQDNEALRNTLRLCRGGMALFPKPDALAFEHFRARGMPTANEELDTVFETGRLVEAWGGQTIPVPRSAVKMHLCGSARAKDGNIRAAVIDRLGKPGTKKAPGRTYGIVGHEWQALGLAIVAAETMTEKKPNGSLEACSGF